MMMLVERAKDLGIQEIDEVTRLVKSYDFPEAGCISIDQTISNVLRSQGLENIKGRLEKEMIFPITFPMELLNPQVSDPDAFISWLDDFALNHNAVDHHLLHSFARGAYGKHHVRILHRFLKFRLENLKVFKQAARLNCRARKHPLIISLFYISSRFDFIIFMR